MIPVPLAIRLREAGLEWKPASGDRFVLPDRDLDEVFVLSDMTISVHRLPDQTVIGFNGTTEWALDDVEQDEAVWLPAEDQLRGLLGDAFQRLERSGGRYAVVVSTQDGGVTRYSGDGPETAYAEAVLARLAAG